MVNLGFLASHRGSNFQAVVDACKAGALKARPVVVISNNSGSLALQRAAREGIAGYHLSGRTHPDPERLDHAINDIFRRHEADYIVLAGYMKKLGPNTLKTYRGRILNIHPALLPRHGGPGMYGRRVHEAVLAAGDRETGVTVHLVDENYDTGPILAQCRIRVESNDTADTLALRVLEREHVFLVETLQQLLEPDANTPSLKRLQPPTDGSIEKRQRRG